MFAGVIWFLHRDRLDFKKEVVFLAVLFLVLVFMHLVVEFSSTAAPAEDFNKGDAFIKLQTFYVFRLPVLLFSGMLVGCGVRDRPVYGLVIVSGILVGWILSAAGTTVVALQFLVATGLVLDCFVCATVVVRLVEVNWGPQILERFGERVHSPLVFLVFVLFLMMLVPTFVPQETIIAGVNAAFTEKSADSMVWVDAATGQELPPLPPGTSLLEILTRYGNFSWLFPMGIVTGYLFRVPVRFANRLR